VLITGKIAGSFLVTAIAVLAQGPLIYNRSVYNAASFLPPGIPGSPIARGSIFSIFGTRIGPATAVRAQSFPLGTTLGNVSITFAQGGTTVNVLPIFVSATQINAIMPSNAPLGTGALQITFNNGRSNFIPVRVAAASFGIFTALGTGIGPGILQNFVTQAEQPINSPTIPAQRGQVITLWGTGLGAVAGGDNVAPPAGNLPVQVEVFVGGQRADVLYSGRTPCCSGTDQIVFRVPETAPIGCWVPVVVRTAGTTVSNTVTMSIGQTGASCPADVFPEVAATLINGGKGGASLLTRVTTRHDGPLAIADVTGDYHAFTAVTAPQSPFPFHPVLSLPPAGTCTAYASQGDLLRGDADLLPGTLPATPQLDFGSSFQVTGPRGARTLSSLVATAHAGYFGGMIGNNLLRDTRYLDPGSYSISGIGGMTVGPFSASIDVPGPLTWTNREQIGFVNRGQPLNIAWSGGASGQFVVISGFSVDLPTNSTALFSCVAPPGAASFSVPATAMANFPASRANPLQSKGVIYVISIPASGPLGAPGLDMGFALFSYINGKSVLFQ
jgi:uncharacterized protein (TIGR03437 family)